MERQGCKNEKERMKEKKKIKVEECKRIFLCECSRLISNENYLVLREIINVNIMTMAIIEDDDDCGGGGGGGGGGDL